MVLADLSRCFVFCCARAAVLRSQTQARHGKPIASPCTYIRRRRHVCKVHTRLLGKACAGHAGHTHSVVKLLPWAEEAGTQCKSLKFDTTLDVRGLVAREDIPGKSVIVTLPRHLALAVSARQTCPVPHLVSQEVWSSTEK